MEEFILAILHFILAFILTYIAVMFWIKVAKRNNLTGKDMNKYKSREVAEAGGVAVIISFCMIILLYIFLVLYVFQALREYWNDNQPFDLSIYLSYSLQWLF